MKIISVQMKNIKSHRDTELVFSGGINVLSGPNGAGKSTVFEAIGYALFGVDARDFVSNMDRFISIGSKRGEISVVFSTDAGEIWKASRSVGQSSRWLLLKGGDGGFEVEEHANACETEKRIAGLLGLDNGRSLPEQFKLVIGPFQNDFLGPFVIRQQTRRQETFDEILGIDAWRNIYKGTGDLLKAVRKKIEVVSAEITILQEHLLVLPQKQEELDAVSAAQKQKQEELQQKDAALKEREKVLADLDSREKGINSLKAELIRIEERIKDGTEKTADKQKEVDASRMALVLLDASRSGRDAYEAAGILLAELRAREQQRRAAEKEIGEIEKTALRLAQTIEHEQAEIARSQVQLLEEEAAIGSIRAGLEPEQALLDSVSSLPLLRSTLEALKSDAAKLDGRTAGLEEGREKLAEGCCPFFMEECRNLEGRAAHLLFAEKLEDLARARGDLDKRIDEAAGQAGAAEKAEKELHAIGIRIQELQKQLAGLEGRRVKNSERSEKLEIIKQRQAEAAGGVIEKKSLLQQFSTLDKEIEQGERQRTENQQARDLYLANQKDAGELEIRSRTLEKWCQRLEELRQELADRQNELARAVEDYQPENHRHLMEERDRLLAEVSAIRQHNEELERNCIRLSQEISRLLQIQEEVASKQAWLAGLLKKERLVKFLRNQVFKNVSEQLSERFREEISQRADRIYRTISQSDEELVWGEKYQILLRDMDGGIIRERSDDQLSGGQTMSAVVALRLAMLQSIGARIAFFDEPTSNLDATRRENLAEAFRAIDVGHGDVTEHWYDQLFLVSHDLSFTEITEQIIQLGE